MEKQFFTLIKDLNKMICFKQCIILLLIISFTSIGATVTASTYSTPDPPEESLVVIQKVTGHHGGQSYGEEKGTLGEMIDLSGMDNSTDDNDPSTWIADEEAWIHEWQSLSLLSAGTNSKIGWVVIELGSVTDDLEDLYIWNERENAPRTVDEYNLYYASSPTMAVPEDPGQVNTNGDYDFASGGWTQIGTTLNMSSRFDMGGEVESANAVVDLGGVSAKYIAIEIISNNGDMDRVGLAEIALTTTALPLDVTMVVTDVSCNGGSDGTITATATGGVPPYKYEWVGFPDDTTSTITGLPARSLKYKVIVTDSGMNEEKRKRRILEPDALTISFVSSNADCQGSETGSATASAAGGIAPYTYFWSNGETTETISDLHAGAYMVTATDSNGCTSVSAVTITDPNGLVVSVFDLSNVSCNGGNDGSVSIIVSLSASGTSPYTLRGYFKNGVWAGDINLPFAPVLGADHGIIVDDLEEGQYSFYIQDANGCQITVSTTVDEPTELISDIITSTDVSCYEDSDGTATVYATGGTTPYTYAWTGGATSATATGLDAGTYTVTITDANDCTVVSSTTISEPGHLFITRFGGNDVSCYGGSDGNIYTQIWGGTAPYTYIWLGFSAADNVQDALNIPAGWYTLIVIDANGCSAFKPFIQVEQPPLLTVYIDNVTHADCAGNGTGSATAYAAGGTGSYTYAWSNGDDEATAYGMHAGGYSVTATDENGCTAQASTTITDPNGMSLEVTESSQPWCKGDDNGSVTLGILNTGNLGGTPPYTLVDIYFNGNEISVDMPFTGNTLYVDGLDAGQYVFVVRDDNNCEVAQDFTMDEPTLLIADVTTSTDVSCSGGSDGTGTVYATGGTTPYGYEWSNGQTTVTATGLSIGTHSVTVTDANGCQESEEIEIGEPGELSLTLNSTEDVSCYGGSDGYIYIGTTGGTAPYNYTWTGSSPEPIDNAQDAQNISAGTYSVEVTDANGCTFEIEDIVITEPTELTVTIGNVMNADCAGNETGSATATGAGGTGTITYTWSNGDATATASALHAGGYSVTATDANGCTAQASVSITDPTGMSMEVLLSNQPSCNGGDDGSVTLGILNTGNLGGTPPYTLVKIIRDLNATVVSTPFVMESLTINDLVAGQYSFIVVDANGCEVVEEHTLDEPTLLIAEIISSTGETCLNAADGTATVNATGGTTPYTYLWSDGQTVYDATGFVAGTYTVTVTDANGCEAITSVVIGDPDTTDPVIESFVDLTFDCSSISSTTDPSALLAQWLENNYVASDDRELVGVSYDYTAITLDLCTASTTVVTWTATDACGNTATATSNLIIDPDVTAPTLTVPAPLAIDCASISSTSSPAALVAAWLAEASISDDCDNAPTLTHNFDNGALDVCAAADYSITVTWTATDACGNTTSDSQTIDVTVDVMAPTLTVPSAPLAIDCASISSTSSPAAMVDAWMAEAGATDGCDNAPSLVHSFDSSQLDVCAAADYSITVTWTATDACGNTTSDSQTIDVTVDVTAPTLTVPSAPLAIDCASISSTSSPAAMVDAWMAEAGATDGCDNAPSLVHSFDSSQLDVCAAADYSITVTWTATDACGNTTSDSQTIDVTVDVTAPTLTVPSAPLAIDCASISSTSSPAAMVDAWMAEAGATDGCDNAPSLVHSFDSSQLDVCAAADYSITVTWTATDACGNTTSDSQTIDVTVDVTAPTLTVPSAPLAIDCASISSTSSPAAMVDAWMAEAGATDGCDNAPSLVHSFDSSQLDVCAAADYSITVTWTATDACGNTTSDSQTIDVTVDVTAPTLTVPSAPLAIDCASISSTSSPAAMVDAWMAEAGATDGCDNAPSLVHSFDSSQLDVCAAADYSITVTWTATDACGNTTSDSQTIDVTVDVTAPTLTVPSAPLAIDCASISSTSSPAAMVDAWMAEAGATDGCDNAPSLVHSFDSSQLDVCAAADYSITVTWTATDACGNTTSDSQTIDVTVDVTAPTLTVPSAPLAIDCASISSTSSPAAMVDAWMAEAGATDGCDNAPSLVHSFDSSQLDVCAAADYSITVTWTATDACGNTTSDSQTIDVTVDVTAPTLTVPSAPLAIDCASISSTSSPAAMVDAWMAEAGATDGCDNAPSLVHSFDSSQLDVCAAADYSITVTWTATDACGNTTSDSQTIDVTVDVTAPTLTVPSAPLAIDCASISSTSSPAAMVDAWMAEAGATDGCDNAPSLVHSFDSSQLDVCAAADYSITVTWTATDACGNTTSDSQTIDVTVDVTAPTLTVPSAPLAIDCASISSTSSPAAMVDAWMAEAGATDGCDNAPSLVHSFDSSQLDVCAAADYSITVTWTATDACGNTTSDSQTIDVTVDVTAPTITAPADVTFDADVNCNFVLSDYTSTIAGDDCDSDVQVSQSPLPGTVLPLGLTVVTLTATDNCGNESDDTFNVVVEDNTNPVAICQDITVQLDASGNATIVAADVDNSSFDNCSVASLSIDVSTFTCADLGSDNQVILTVTDGSGNTATCIANVIVEDNVAPTFTCPAALDVQGCDGLVPDLISTIGDEMDNCGIVTLTQSPLPGVSIGNNGNSVDVVVTATDASGNTSSCTVTVTVVDDTAPVFQNCPTAISVANDPDQCGAIVSWIAPVALDNCIVMGPGSVVLTAGMPSGSVFPVGTSTVTYTATDDDGNTTTCTFNVTVSDTESPEFITTLPADEIVECDAIPDPFVVIPMMHTVDNCTEGADIIVDYGEEIIDIVCDHTYTIVRTWTITDEYGNSAVHKQKVYVQDTTAPTFTVPADVTIECDESTDPSNTGDVTDEMDNCDSAPVVAYTDIEDLTGCGGYTGTITRTWTVTDACGNVTTKVQVITIEDTTGPDAVCQNITVELDDNGEVVISANDVNNGSTDNCAAQSALTLAISKSSFTCADIGANLVTLTVTDPCGNIGTCVATVTVEDNIAPVIACPDDMIIHLDPGACEQVLSYDILATDNCAVTVEQIAGSFGSGDGFPIGGPYVLTYEATDEGGNTAQCSFSVTVFEYVPTSNDMTCNSLVNISLDENCEAIISADQILEGNNYGCYDDYIITSEDANGNVVPGNVLDITHVGMTITVTITDPVTGVSCWGTVYVEDKLVPEFDCPADVTIACSENATPSLTGEPVITSCELSHTVTSVDIFTDFGQCADPRAQIERTWTVTDDSGNSATCVQLITIAAVDLADVIFPADLVDANALECSDVSNNPSLTESGNAGFPTINGLEITNSGLCMASINVSDEVYDICEGSYEILRTWKVRNMCLPIGPGNPVEHIQIIKVLDTEGPVVEAPADITISTSGTSCETGFTAPAANITDGCSTFSVVTDTPFGSLVSNGGSLSQALDLGTHTITYIATDGCGNVGFDVMTITVEDQIAPIAICDENTTVSLDNNGFGSIAAITFDDGSYDNCSDVTFEVRKVFNSCDPTNNAFGSSVSFCCEEVGTEVMVELRVTDAAGNFNACMVLVDVQDKIDPTVICPTDADVDCSETYLDYIEVGQALPQDAVDANGEAVAIDNCTVASLTSNVIGNTVDCGSGTITIVWTATDGGGRTSSCIQRYFVTNSDIFSESDITWPLDYTANTCGTGLEPSDLSSPYNYPTVDEGACNNVAVGHDDQVLGFGVGDACLKVLRKWYVIDWCQAGANQDPTQPGPGVWHYTQIIKVINSNDPTVTVVNFPSVVDNYDADCGNVFVAFDITADDDCTAPADLQVSWEFSTGLSGTGLSASGSFANGSYSLTYTVSDGCSNTVWEIHDFTVVDAKQPTPVCIFGIATTVMPSSGAVTIHASDFESGSSYDNCTAYDDLAFSFSQDVNNVNITIACADIPANGLYPITLYVTDEAGNSDFCSTFINVQDPNGVCVTPTGLITGTIENEFQEVIEEVTVTLSDDNGIMNVPVVTGPTGIFQFNQTYGDYDVTPEKDINHLNGVTTYDLVLISKHILGIELFDSPYKMIAADANNSGAITALDLVKIRSVILYLDDEFTNNTSWRFVEQDYVFPDPTNPWTEEFPEFIGLTTTIDPANFTAIKVGDVNGSASPNSLLGSDTRTFSGNLALQLEAIKVAEGETFTVDFRAKDFKQIAGYQFTLEFDNAAVDFVDVRTNLEGLGSENFGLTKIEEGVITTSWNSSKGINVADNKVLFSMTFLANTTANTAEVFTINSRYTESEAYNGTELFNVVLEFNGNEVESVFELYQNIPNPFKEETNISFNLPQAGAVTLRIMDVAGRTLKLINMDAAKGMNSVSLTRDEFNATGVLYYQLESADNTATMKMIIVD